MVESEARADFDSFNRTIPCISALQLEKQFQVVYTNVKFKEVHEQFVKMMSCNNALLKSEGAISTFEVVEYVAVGDHLIEKIFLVYFNENELEVKCTCALFEVKGILCRHSLFVLRTKKVTTLPQRYVLDRWRKDVKREYSKVKSSYDAISDNPHAQIHDKVRNNLKELLSLTSVNTEKRCIELMEKIDQLKELWRCENQSFGIPATVASSSCKKVLSPVKIDCKGRPRTKRKVSVIETVVNKSKVSSKPPRNNNDKTKKQKNQASKSTENQDNTSQSPLPSVPSAAHDHSTQDSVASSSTVAHTFSGHHHSILSQVDKRWVLTMDPLPLSQEAKVVGKTSFAGSFPGYDEYVPMVDKAVDASWKKQASLQRPCTSKVVGVEILSRHWIAQCTLQLSITGRLTFQRILCTSIQLEKHEDSGVDFVENTKIDNIELL
ncbi:protein FAR1-RELATED SEQUENCE 2-like [Alnus glutinosa]|uniref:protein FAR1-RELATED SEQUENCE 2-like n=1 Tax=Alnus glutinosa TaxID=3517 RepID=UPI002D769951|nr:protein FAR1-RELATED SEQUENCE 2-like [Alnus glutinosa]